MNNRPGEVAGIERVADPQTLYHLHEFLGIAIENLLCHQHSAGRNTALAAGLECTDDSRGNREIKTGILANDDSTLRSHLAGDNPIVMLGRELLDSMAYIVTASEENDIDFRRFDQRLGSFFGAMN